MAVNRKYGIGMLRNTACRKHKHKEKKHQGLDEDIRSRNVEQRTKVSGRKQQTSRSYKLGK